MEHRFKKKPHFKMLSLFLALILCLGLWMPVTAQEAAGTDVPDGFVYPEGLGFPTQEEIRAAEESAEPPAPIDPALVPAVVGQTRAEERFYVARAYDLESELNEVALKRADGKVDIYLYSFPVKYEAGGVQYDKNPQLTAAGRGFVSDKNTDLALTCGATAAEGFTLRGNGLDLSLRPLSLADYRALGGKSEDKSDVFRNGTAKEASVQSPLTEEAVTVPAAAYEIGADTVLSIVPGYIGAHLTLTRGEKSAHAAFFFRLETHGLKLEEGDGALILLRDGTPVAMIGCPTDERTNELQPYTLTQANDGSYLLRVEANGGQNLLLSAVQYYDYLQDVTVYSNDQTVYNSGLGVHLYTGRHASVKMERILLRPNQWRVTATDLPGYTISEAKVVLRDVMANNTGNIECRKFTGNDWQESTAYWNLVNGGYSGTLYSTVQVTPSGTNTGTAHYFAFDATDEILNWYHGGSYQKGLVFRWDSDTGTTNKEFTYASCQYSNNTNYRPKIEVTLTAMPQLAEGIYRIRNMDQSLYITANASIQSGNEAIFKVYQSNYVYNQMWRVKYVGGGYYTLRPMHFTPLALTISGNSVVTSGGVSAVDYYYDEESPGLIWNLIPISSSGNTYYNIYQEDAAMYLTATDGMNNTNEPVSAEYDWYGDSWGCWYFEPVSNAPDRVLLYDLATEEPVENPTLRMNAGETKLLYSLGLAVSVSRLSTVSISDLAQSYTDQGIFFMTNYLRFTASGVGLTDVTLGWTSGGVLQTKKFSVSSLLVDPGIYYVKNKDTEGYLDIVNRNMQDGALINQGELDGSAAQRWNFQYLFDGYYTIRSMNASTDYYLGVSGDSLAAETAVKLRTIANSAFTDGTKWKIATTSSGAYKITPKTGETNNRVLAVGSYNQSGIGTQVYQRDYSNDTDYKDEWLLIRALPTNGYEITYNASSWAGVPSSNCNCYAYAINNQVIEPVGNQIWYKQQPGEYYNIHRGNAEPIPQGFHPSSNLIVSAVAADFNKYNSVNGATTTFVPVGRYETCPVGSYKVALVVSSSDYHWYRQDSDGLWSHKRGTTPVKRTDESGNLIIDPYIADRDNYTTFVGFYAVKPWNNMYVSAKGEEYVGWLTADNEIDEIKLSSITIGMSLNSVIERTGSTGEDIGSGILIQRFVSNHNNTYIFEYESVCGEFYVKSITIQEG